MILKIISILLKSSRKKFTSLEMRMLGSKSYYKSVKQRNKDKAGSILTVKIFKEKNILLQAELMKSGISCKIIFISAETYLLKVMPPILPLTQTITQETISQIILRITSHYQNLQNQCLMFQINLQNFLALTHKDLSLLKSKDPQIRMKLSQF